MAGTTKAQRKYASTRRGRMKFNEQCRTDPIYYIKNRLATSIIDSKTHRWTKEKPTRKNFYWRYLQIIASDKMIGIFSDLDDMLDLTEMEITALEQRVLTKIQARIKCTFTEEDVIFCPGSFELGGEESLKGNTSSFDQMFPELTADDPNQVFHCGPLWYNL